MDKAAIKRIRERLSQEMYNSGMSLTEIATKLGCSVAIVALYRSKERTPSLENFARLCEILDVSADYVLKNDFKKG